MYNHLCSQECVCVYMEVGGQSWVLFPRWNSFILFYVSECSACMNLYEPSACQKRMFDTLKLERQLRVAMRVLGIERRSSGRAIAFTKPSLCFPI